MENFGSITGLAAREALVAGRGLGAAHRKKAMLIVTTGGRHEHYSARGINEPMEELLFPIHHGILYYPGYDVLPPFILYKADRLDKEGFNQAAKRLRLRMRTLGTTAAIPYRRQNDGDYLIPTMQLRPGLEHPGASGFALHLKSDEAREAEELLLAKVQDAETVGSS